MSREMKNSCIPWIGMIPSTWQKIKVKQSGVKTGSGTTPKSEISRYYGGSIPWIQSGDLYGTDRITSTSKTVTGDALAEYSALKTYKKPFIVLAMYGASVGNIAISDIDACVNQACCVILPDTSNDISFLKYWLMYCKSDFIKQSVGSGQPNISQDKILNQVYVKPSISEQNAIAYYLDSHCSAIDSAISKHQQIIEKLEEYRKAVITQAVTNGLNPNVEMKDSGDSIIPIVPSHWLWTRVKFTVNVVRGGSPRPIEQYIIGEKEDGYNWIKIGDATGGGKFIIATKQRIKPDGLNKTRLVHAGTLLLTNSMSFGHPYFLQIDGCIHDGWLAFSDYKGVLPAFLYYYLMSETTAHQFTTTADGSVVQNLNIDKVRNSHIALPPIVEQKAIVQYLDTVDGKINTAIQHHNQIIEKLQEYKQSLIYNAVTGKIDCTTEA